MNNKLLMAFRMIFSVALMIIIAGLLTTTPVQSADPDTSTLYGIVNNRYLNDINVGGITVNPISGLGTTEASGFDTFGVVLTEVPTGGTATVRIDMSSLNTAEGTVSPAFLEFDDTDWFTEKFVTVTGVDDSVDDGDIVYTIETSEAITTATNYIGVNPADVSVTNIDDDTAGITVVPLTAMETTESLGPASFTVALSSQPTDTVTVAVSSDTPAEGIVTAPLILPLTFTTVNWDSPQTVTVTGQNDDIDDDDIPYNIVLDPASSGDPLYDGLPNVPVAVTNIDDDTAGLTVVTTPPMQTTEAGGTASFTVALSSQPTDIVTVALASDTPGEGIVTLPLTPILTFSPGTWNTPQPVTVTGQNDFIVDGDIPYNIILDPASVGDTTYNSLANVPVAVTNIDNDISGLTVVTTPPMQTTEAGGTASFTVALSTQPTANVTVAVSSSNIFEGVVSAPLILPLTFTPGTWNTPQPVTVTGVDDLIVDNIVAYNIVLNPASLGDPLFDVLPNVNVGVTNIDRLTVVTTPPMYTTEGDGTAKFTIALFRQPTTSVTISLSSDTQAEATVTEPVSGSLTFTTLNWDTPQNITVTGKDDCDDDGDIPYKVTFTSTSLDSDFNKIESLNLINYDAPTIDWVEPVGTEGIYFSDGLNPINLEVESVCPELISKVRFYRYVPPPNEDWITIGENDKPPYREEIQPYELEPGWNQVFAFAFGPPNPVQTTSKHLRILILDEIEGLIFLPFMNK